MRVLESINEYLASLFNDTVRKNIQHDQILYHYTNIDALISILQKKTFWLSNVELMNDKNEINYSLGIIEKALISLNISVSERNLLLSDFLELKKYSALKTYVLSFSLDKDSLILWNNYSKYDGYNIGLSLDKILKNTNDYCFKVKSDKKAAIISGKVLYSEEDQIKFMSGILNAYYQILLLTRDNRNPEVQNQVITQKILILLHSSLLKEEAHQYENEYRIVIGVPDDAISENFRSRNGLILPYIEVELNDYSCFKEITIGPKIDDNFAKSVLDYFLSKIKESKIESSKSDIKLRF